MENKVIRREQLGEEISLDYKEHSIEIFENIVSVFKDLGATHIDLYVDKDYDGCVESVGFTPFKISYETDEEKEIRLKKEKEDKELQEGRAKKVKEEFERNLLKQLKEKYEKAN